jgi:hypothetical protein
MEHGQRDANGQRDVMANMMQWIIKKKQFLSDMAFLACVTVMDNEKRHVSDMAFVTWVMDTHARRIPARRIYTRRIPASWIDARRTTLVHT